MLVWCYTTMNLFISTLCLNLGSYSIQISSQQLVPSLGKYVYYVSFVNDFSRNARIYLLKKKYDVCDIFKEFKALVANQIEK